MKNLLATAVLLLLSPVTFAECTLTWGYDTPEAGWIEGFRVYQSGTEVGTAPSADRSGICADLGLVPGPGPITMTAFRGTDESPQSAPASFTLAAPGIQISITIN